ncbi:MAG: ankyrin repeat domain-containing protein [Tepidisphaerales bacterium]
MRASIAAVCICGILSIGSCVASAADVPATRPTTRRVPATLPARESLLRIPNGAKSVTLPMARGGQALLIQPRIDGKEIGWFFLSTRFNGAVIDREVARLLKIPTLHAESATASDVYGKPLLVEVPEMELGGLVVRRHIAWSSDLSQAGSLAQLKIAGVIGGAILRELPFTIDFRAGTLTFYDRKGFVPLAGAREERLVLPERDVPLVAGRIGDQDANLLISTGCAGELSLSGPFANLHRDMLEGKHWVAYPTFGAAKPTTEYSGRLGPVEILGRRFTSVETDYTLAETDELSAQRAAGEIGLALLHDARLTADYATGRVWVQWLPPEACAQAVARFNTIAAHDLIGESALLSALDEGRTDAAIALLKAGANPNAENRSGVTALMRAAANGDLQAANALLAKGAKLDTTSVLFAQTALIRAAGAGHKEVVAALVSAGADPNYANTLGRTALADATAGNWPEIVQLLLSRGAKVSPVAQDKSTPLLTAANEGHMEIARILLEHGAKTDLGALSELAAAAARGDLPMMRLLLAHGANVNVRDSSGATPLMLAAGHGWVEAAVLLLSAGADASYRSSSGTARDAAVQYAQSPKVRFLDTLPTTRPTTLPANRGMLVLPEGTRQVEVPLARAGSYMLCRPRIGGQQVGWFLVDTGASITFIDKALAARLGLRTVPSRQGRTPGGFANTDAAEVRDLSVGDVHIPHSVVSVVDLKAMAMRLPLEGIIGMTTLRQVPTTIDFHDARLIFYAPDTFKEPVEKAVSVPVKRLSGGCQVLAVVAGKPTWLGIDSGSQIAAGLHPSFALEHPELFPYGPANTRSIVLTGSMPETVVSIPSLQVLGRTFNSIQATYSLTAREGSLGYWGGNVGAELLAKSRLTFDANEARLWVQWADDEDVATAVRRLSEVGAKDLVGTPPLTHAVLENRVDVAIALLKQGMDPNATSKNNDTPLELAAERGQVEMVKALLAHGATVSVSGRRALVTAATGTDAEIVRILLVAGVNPNVSDNSGIPMLVRASHSASSEIVEMLLRAGAKPNLASTAPAATAAEADNRAGEKHDPAGITALMAAASRGDTRIMRLLLEAGADVNQADTDGGTPLMYAAAANRVEAVRLLVAAGADPAAHGKHGTARDCAITAGSRDALQILLLGY